jgi:hypothetical protein
MKKTLYLAIALGLFSCGNAESTGNEKKSDESKAGSDTISTATEVVEVKKKDLPFDQDLTNISRVIAGLPVEGDSALETIQAKPFYKKYKDYTDRTFSEVKSTMLDPVAGWTDSMHVGNDAEGITCFYPLSGPDFMFANAFYPNAKNYILMALERRGSLPNFKEMTDEQLQRYFDGMIKSMKYITTRGYFVTMHMGSDFSKSHLNGTLHMILYMMARTGHKIAKVEDGLIDSNGNLTRIDEKQKDVEAETRIKTIDFVSPDGKQAKTLYFFNQNADDEHLPEHPGIEKFINGFERRSAYMKASQCALFNPNFKKIRELVLSCDEVIQDDSGLPYKYYSDTTEYDTYLYGTYKTVIKDLSWCYQKDLKKAIDASEFNYPLPFKITYNDNHGFGMILYAIKK